ncbi:MAG: SIS domain-containing protein [Chloroflexi bacterium]|nr:SIS domain-containing protein [Chloroflexota bacterium]
MSSPADSELERAQAHLLASAEVQRATAARCLPAILAAADLIAGAFEAGGKLLLCGNGGSAAQCQHIAAEFVGRLTRDFVRRALPAIALTTDTTLLTAFANDCCFEAIFARQVEALQRPGDVLIAVSTSGDSPNVIRAVESARAAGLRTVALTGQGGRLAAMAEVVIAVPSTNTQHVQEAHLAIGHILCDLVERRLCGEKS